ncbi:acyl-CoA-like ligand-binding transcription factor [Amycolatopsis sp. H20-H5]|uniref:acyl-CoA-like ligand-binding transcription factor n=1 Tax=Amycolatopsis sp. H20-H5 TaxID=3046309 RepID=UPI002DB64C2C|nr:TetR family transcriptional regulator [Amycolatopsis sp. H20-H5]MEC3981482.1 TetR family transcriptional regulator [Amycolatopsis sp. H20-H5]
MSTDGASRTSAPELSLRESKKRAARHALSWAALRLASEHGFDNLRVEDIATEVGVSARTFNNYFSSKEEAVCSFNVERQERLREALLARPSREPLWTAVINAVSDQHTADGQAPREFIDRFRILMQHPALHGEFLKSHARMEVILADAIAERVGIDADDTDGRLSARLMAGLVGNATRVAMIHWFQNEDEESLLPILRRLLTEVSEGLPSLTTRPGRLSGERARVTAPAP